MPTPMDEQTLVAILQTEERDAASYYSSELAKVQADAMDAFQGKLVDDVQLPNRSKVVTHDVEDTVNWIMPHLMRTFARSDDLIAVDDPALDDGDQQLEDARSYLDHVFWRDNNGEQIIHDFAFDGCLQRIGVARAYWCDPEPQAPIEMEGVTLHQISRLVNDQTYEILEAAQDGEFTDEETEFGEGTTEFGDDDEDNEAPGEPDGDEQPPQQPGPPQPAQPQAQALVPQPQQMQAQPPQPEPTFRLRVRRWTKGRAVVECIAPEEFRISRRAKSIDEADYHAWQHDQFLADLVRMHSDHAHDLDPTGNNLPTATQDTDSQDDLRTYARFPDEPLSGQSAANKEEARRKTSVIIEYIRVDYDGDGIVELRRVKRVGRIILENDTVEESEFVAWTPIRVAHRLTGRSLADTIMDIQKIRTSLSRFAMDGLARSLAPRTAINKRSLASDPSLLDRFLDHDVGDVLEIDGDPSQAIMVLQTPDVSASAFSAIEYWDRRSEEATGVNRHAQGIQPQAITDTAHGIDMLQAAANARVELVARWLGGGLERLMTKLMRVLVRNQDQPRVIKVNGRRMEIDPRRWSDEMTLSVHVGVSGESREKRIMMLDKLLGMQKDVLVNMGLDNPLAGVREVRNTVAEMTSVMGYKSASKFWKQIPPNWQPPPPQPDPKHAEMQGKMELAQAELQSRMQLQQAEMQHKSQVAEQDAQHKLQIAQNQAQISLQIEKHKAEIQAGTARDKMQMDQQINAAKLQSEADLAQQRMHMEERLALQKMAQERDIALAAATVRAAGQPGGKPPPVNGGFRPGGALDA